MTIILRPEQEEFVRQLVAVGTFENPEDAVGSALEMLRGQNDWLHANSESVDAQIRQGIAELERGEGIPDDELDAHLSRLKAETD